MGVQSKNSSIAVKTEIKVPILMYQSVNREMVIPVT